MTAAAFEHWLYRHLNLSSLCEGIVLSLSQREEVTKYREIMTNLPTAAHPGSGRAGTWTCSGDPEPTLCHTCLGNVPVWVGRVLSLKSWIPKSFPRSFPCSWTSGVLYIFCSPCPLPEIFVRKILKYKQQFYIPQIFTKYLLCKDSAKWKQKVCCGLSGQDTHNHVVKQKVANAPGI